MPTAYTYNLAYRFRGTQSGTPFIEGFTGTSLSSEFMARAHAIHKAARKCAAIGETFQQRNVIENPEPGLTPAEFEQLRSDWKISARSSIV